MRKDLTIFKDDRYFAAWPAGFICKTWGKEILVGFFKAPYKNSQSIHNFDREEVAHLTLARSYDAGDTWEYTDTDLLDPAPKASMHNAVPLSKFEGTIDFSDPDFVLLFNMSGTKNADYSWWHYSTDRGHTWHGPYMIHGMPEITTALHMRTAYKVMNKDEIIFVGTCAKQDGREGKCFCAKMKNGGKDFEFLGYINEKEEYIYGSEIMPRFLTRKDGSFVCITRVKVDNPMNRDQTALHRIYESYDQGKTWTYMGIPNDCSGWNAFSFSALPDGTWVMAYGARSLPYGLRCRYSEDEGRHWSHQIILRKDSEGMDLGYPNSDILDDGSLFISYYYSMSQDSPRTIEAIILDKDYLLEKASKK